MQRLLIHASIPRLSIRYDCTPLPNVPIVHSVTGSRRAGKDWYPLFARLLARFHMASSDYSLKSAFWPAFSLVTTKITMNTSDIKIKVRSLSLGPRRCSQIEQNAIEVLSKNQGNNASRYRVLGNVEVHICKRLYLQPVF
jgi:hypothetical protein